MTRNFKTIAAATVASVAILGAAATQFAPSNASPAADTPIEAPATPVTVAYPTVKPIIEWDEYTGRFEAIDRVDVRSRVSGYLTEVAFTEGQVVKKGDLLFKIDARPFEAALRLAEAEAGEAQARLRLARQQLGRTQTLVSKGHVSRARYDQHLAEMNSASASVEAANARVEAARLDVEYTEVRSPITGRISDEFVSLGNLINGGAQGGTLLTTIVSMDPIHFEFTASEADYLKYVRLDQSGSRPGSRDNANPVQVKLLDEASFSHTGSMSFVDNQLDISTGTMRGRATFANPDGTFAPGMFGRLRLVGSGEYDAVMISDSAIQTDQAEKFVWVADTDDVAQRRTVELGPIIDGLRVIRGGLEGSDRVIVAGTQFVASGAKLAPAVDPTSIVAQVAAQ